jgi:cytochrome P450/NADPH-cytochrome P450 reductase
MHLALVSIFQKFDLVAADPATYSLTMQSTLTIKAYLKIRAIPRAGRAAHAIFPSPSSALQQARDERTSITLDRAAQAAPPKGPQKGMKPLYILYGSNTGSCESFAKKIATAAPSYGKSSFSYAGARVYSTGELTLEGRLFSRTRLA